MKNQPTKLSSTAQRITRLLGDISADSPAARRKGLTELKRAVIQDNALTAAAVEATPLLAAAAAAPDQRERGQLLALLADLAVGGDHVACLTSGFDLNEPSLADLPADHPLIRVHRAVAAGLDGYLSALAAAEVATRTAAPLVLAFLSGEATRSIAPVRAHAQQTEDPHEPARASAVLALGYLARYLKSEEDTALLTRLHDGSSGLVRVAAALALVQLCPAGLGEGPRQTLCDALTSFEAKVTGFPWCHGEVAHFASLALACVGVEARDPALLLGVLDTTAEMPTHTAVANALVDAAFGDGASPRLAASLSPLQRQVLETIIDRNLSPHVFFTLARQGVPPDPDALRRYLGLDPAGPLDREVTGEPLWRLGLRALQGDATAADRWVTAVTEDHDADSVMATATDALEEPYALATLIPNIAEDCMETERRRWVAAEQLAGRALAKALDPARLGALAESLSDSPELPLAAATLFAAAEQASGRGAALDAHWDDLIAGVAAENASPELRRIVATLPEARREAVIHAVPFLHELEEDENGEPVIYAGGAWALADLCPTNAVAELVITALGDIDPDDDDPPPVARAQAIFSAMGQVGQNALAAAANRRNQPQRELLSEILQALK